MFYKSTKSVVCKYGVESINLKNNKLFGIKKKSRYQQMAWYS